MIAETARIASIILQVVAVIMALRLIPVTGRRIAWACLSGALALQLGLRLWQVIGPVLRTGAWPAPDLVSELVRIGVTSLLLVSISFIGPYFSDLQESEEALRRERDRTRRYLNVSSTVLIGFDAIGRITMMNRAGCELLACAERDVVGQNWFDLFVPEEEREERRSSYLQLLEQDEPEPSGTDHTLIALDGRKTLVTWAISLLRDASGKTVGMLASAEDVTERRRVESELEFRSFLLDSATDSIFVHDTEGNLMYVNEAARIMLSYPTRESLMNAGPWAWVDTLNDPDRIRRNFRRIESTGSTIFESVNRRLDGTLIPVEVHSQYIEWDGRTVMASVSRDISERKNAEETITRMAFYDSLTGLANRRLLLDRLKVALAGAERTGEQVALIFLDIDHFKNVNDSLGHPVGDILLGAVGDRLRRTVRDADTVARLGGDEFVILLPRVTSPDSVEVVTSKVLNSFRMAFDVGGHEVHVTASVGIALHDALGDEGPDTLLKNADAAMYTAKESGRNQSRVYHPSMTVRSVELYNLRNDLRSAVENGELELRYQPQVSAATGLITGAEALLRWTHPRLGDIDATTFIPLAEETGIIIPLGEWALHTACRQAAAWRAAGYPIRMAVNLSARQFLHNELVQRVSHVLLDTGMDPGSLELEITEHVAMQDAAFMMDTFGKLREMGVRIAIDDFGTGYSSLDRLKRFPIHTLKIDRTFIHDLGQNADSSAIVTAIIALGRSLGLEIVAEGVETERQLAFLMRRDCDVIQGYLLGRPIRAEEFELLLNAGSMELVTRVR